MSSEHLFSKINSHIHKYHLILHMYIYVTRPLRPVKIDHVGTLIYIFEKYQFEILNATYVTFLCLMVTA